MPLRLGDEFKRELGHPIGLSCLEFLKCGVKSLLFFLNDILVVLVRHPFNEVCWCINVNLIRVLVSM